MTVHDELVRLEHRFWDAAGDPAFYRRHVADEARFVFTFGVMDKAATVASMEEADPWSEVEITETSSTPIADEVAVLTYRASAARDGGGLYEAVVASVYVRRGDDWLLALHQQTPVPAA
jgi:hypothetical protein